MVVNSFDDLSYLQGYLSLINHTVLFRGRPLLKTVSKYMNIRLKGTHLELTEAIKEYVQTKMDLTEKYLGDVQVLNCDFEVEKSLPGAKQRRSIPSRS